MFTINNKRQLDTGIHPIYDCPFNFDLEEMKEALEGPAVEIPEEALVDQDVFHKWLMGTDFNDKES